MLNKVLAEQRGRRWCGCSQEGRGKKCGGCGWGCALEFLWLPLGSKLLLMSDFFLRTKRTRPVLVWWHFSKMHSGGKGPFLWTLSGNCLVCPNLGGYIEGSHAEQLPGHPTSLPPTFAHTQACRRQSRESMDYSTPPMGRWTHLWVGLGSCLLPHRNPVDHSADLYGPLLSQSVIPFCFCLEKWRAIYP